MSKAEKRFPGRMRFPLSVITGLDPVIHVVPQVSAVMARNGVDARNMSGHDGGFKSLSLRVLEGQAS